MTHFRWLALVGPLVLIGGAAGLFGSCDPCQQCPEMAGAGPSGAAPAASGSANASASASFSVPATPTSTPTPPSTSQVSSGQGLIAIDTKKNVGYAPIYTLSSSTAAMAVNGNAVQPQATSGGDAQVAVVDLTVGAANPIIKVLALPGSIQPIASTFDPMNGKIYVEGRQSNNNVNIYEIDTTSQTVINTVAATGITHDGSFGGIVVNPTNNKGVVAGTSTLGLFDASTSPPTFNPASVTDISSTSSCTDSLSLNFNTQILFIACDHINTFVDVSSTPLAIHSFESDFGTTDGNSFDSTTNILVLALEFKDQNFVFNFGALNTSSSPATAPNVGVNGLGTTNPVGEGPGGQATVNTVTHQFVIADEFGQNLRLGQLPSAPITGAPDNNGQPGSNTTADSKSAFTIAATIIPMGNVNGTPTQLGILGDPNSLTIDPVKNFAYMLADTMPDFHSWQGGTTTPLFLIRVDLSNPVFGGTTTGETRWNPSSQAIRMP